jgi:hypothetical protein
LKSPDRVATVNLLDGQKRQWPQLRLFASFGMADAVKQLLEANANVNQLDKQGGSALLCAIQHARDTGDCEVLNLLLQVSHTKETLDSLTEKNRYPLYLKQSIMAIPTLLRACLIWVPRISGA